MSSKARFMPQGYTKAHLKLHKALTKANINFVSSIYQAGFECDIVIRDLVVEVDGESHKRESRRRKDAWKDNRLRAHGFTVLRFTDDQVNKNVADCVAEIVYKLLEKKN